MCSSAPRVCSKPGGQKPVLSLSLDLISEDTWNVLNMQLITSYSKRWDYLDIPSNGHKKIEGDAHMAEGGHQLRKAPNPYPHLTPSEAISHWFIQWIVAWGTDDLSLKLSVFVLVHYHVKIMQNYGKSGVE